MCVTTRMGTNSSGCSTSTVLEDICNYPSTNLICTYVCSVAALVGVLRLDSSVDFAVECGAWSVNVAIAIVWTD